MVKWYKYGDAMINLDKYIRIELNIDVDKYNNTKSYKIKLISELDDDDTDEVFYFRDNKDVAEKCYKEIEEILLSNQKTVNTLEKQIRQLKSDMEELRQMVIHLPIVGSVYKDAKADYEDKINHSS